MIILKKTINNPENNIYPNKKNIFKAFRVCPQERLKVVFLGQDPYLNDKATGLCFANPKDTLNREWSEHLKLIQDALERSFPGNGRFMDPSLEFWAKQGCLFLNVALTTSLNTRAKHIAFWKPITGAILKRISQDRGIVFVLFGTIAEQMSEYIEEGNLIIKLPHPSRCILDKIKLDLDFIKINEYLFEHHGEGISWIELPFE